MLGWFMITDIIYVKIGGFGVWRYRFEKLPTASPSWWKPQGVEEPVQLGELRPPRRQTCSSCKKSCDQVYLGGWMCTEYGCPAWWTFPDGTTPEESSLVPDPRWVKKKTNFLPVSPPFKTKPNPWIFEHNTGADAGLVWQATRGIVCPACGRCSIRVEWSHWTCQEPDCTKVYQLPKSIVEPRHLMDCFNPVDYGIFSHPSDKYPGCDLEETINGNWRNFHYTIPGIGRKDCWILHMASNRRIHEETGGPDDMFSDLQNIDIGLKRPAIGGDGVTNQFTKNFGMPYKFVAEVADESFDTAPKAVHDARARMNWATRQMLGEDKHESFNECLVLGYFEGNMIRYHDDGEKGLGPTIATLSLGDPARMTIRMKRKYYSSYEKNSAFVDREPIMGCEKYDERLAAWKELEKLGPQERKARLKPLAQELGLKGAATGGGPVILDMKVNHGDIVIMHGCKLQEIFEHQVKPLGKLRFAATCRSIDVNSLKPGGRPTYEVKGEAQRYDGLALPPPEMRE